MKLKVDIGMDQLEEKLFQIAIFEEETGDVIYNAYGKTAEEAEYRANILVYSLYDEWGELNVDKL